MNERPALLSIATLTRAHGVRGEMKLHCAPEYVELLQDLAEQGVALTLRMPASGDEFEATLASVRGHESAPIAALDGVDDRVAAERFRGAVVCVPRALLPELPDDEFYLIDLAGCVVESARTGGRLGVVRSARALPGSTVLDVEFDDGGELLVPLIDDAVPVVDVDGRRVTIDAEFLGVAEPAP